MGFNQATFAILAIVVRLSSGACPHEEEGLTPFSSLYTDLTKASVVSVTTPVLLDVTSVDVTQITISETGKLVFNQGHEIVVRTKGILVNGALVIGSVDCRHEDRVNIILYGQRSADQSTVGHEGEKFIAVEGAGELYIHGAEKVSWTKLAATVDRAAAFNGDSSKVKYIHSSTPDKVKFRVGRDGPAVYVFDAALNVISYTPYDFYKPDDPIANEQTEVNKLITLLDSTVENGQVVALATQNLFSTRASTDDLFAMIEEVAGITSGQLLLRDLEQFDAYALVFVKGESQYAQVSDEMISKLTTSALASIDFAGYKVSAQSYIDPTSKGKSWVDFRVLDPSVGNPLVEVLDDISSWNVGDEVALTSTDYEPFHGEIRTIKEIVSTTSFRLSDELLYRKFGKIENKIDMRGEVLMLSRNIRIEGEMSRGCPATNGNCDKFDIDTFGGHIKMMHTFGGAYIQGVEVTHMGQPTDKGRYPIHFHMLKNITGTTAMVEGNSIHHTFQRCVTVHGSFGTSEEQPGVTLKDNVGYDVFGHCYFLEDGAEPATILIGNVAANVREIDNGFFETDLSGVAGYWITSPKTTMIGNVAGGGEGFGIWYTFPNQPVGPSANIYPPVFANEEALHTPLWTFDNNVVHSNIKGGLQFEKIVMDDDGNVDDHLKYHPLENPLDLDSAPVKCQITRLTAYKNRERNVWMRGGVELMQLSSAESKFGILMARGTSTFQQFAKNSVFMGQSIGNAEGSDYPDAYTPQILKYQFGVGFIYGPQYISDSYFIGFNSAADDSFLSGALSFKPKAEFPPSILSAVYNLKFGFDDSTNGNRMFVGNTDYSDLGFGNEDGNELSSIRDLDGSLTACSDFTGVKQVVKPEKFLLTDNCECRDNWKMCISSDLYGQFVLNIKETFSGAKDEARAMQFERVSYADSSDTAYEDHDGDPSGPRANVVLGDDNYYYNMQLTQKFPKDLVLEIHGVESGKDVVIGFCLPEGTTKADLTLKARSGAAKVLNDDFVWESTLQAVRDDDTMATVFMDGRMLYMHFASDESRDSYYDTGKCLSGTCPSFFITLQSENAYTPCFSPTTEQLSTDNVLTSATQQTCILSQSTPDDNWGVGDVMASHDAAWGHWGPWSQCSGGERSRTRLCDSPTVFGGGQDCPDEPGDTDTGTC